MPKRITTAQTVVEMEEIEATNPLAGLVLCTANDILRFDSSGELKLIASGSQGKVSPDGYGWYLCSMIR